MLAIFDFESIRVPSDQLKDKNTTTWMGKHEPTSVSISSNLTDEPVFLCDKDPKALIISFVEAIEDLANKSKTEMRTKCSSIETIIRARINTICENLNKRKDQNASTFEFEDEPTEEDDEADLSTQFLQMQKNQLLDLQQHFERYVNTLPVFGSNSGKYDFNLIKSYLYPILFMRATFNLLLLKRQITLFHLSLVMYNFLISSTFSVELPHLIFSLKNTRQVWLKDSSPMSGLTLPKSSMQLFSLLTTVSLAN